LKGYLSENARGGKEVRDNRMSLGLKERGKRAPCAAEVCVHRVIYGTRKGPRSARRFTGQDMAIACGRRGGVAQRPCTLEKTFLPSQSQRPTVWRPSPREPQKPRSMQLGRIWVARLCEWLSAEGAVGAASGSRYCRSDGCLRRPSGHTSTIFQPGGRNEVTYPLKQNMHKAALKRQCTRRR
jgi:hypothetical protein